MAEKFPEPFPVSRLRPIGSWRRIPSPSDGEVLILDAGAGTNSAFNTLRVPYWKSSRFLVTHYHLDRTADLPPEYVKQMGGVRPDRSAMHGRPAWLEDTVVPVEAIEDFKGQLRGRGAR
ncbi:hypothetical protein ABZ705_05390 [Streptomyces sp. NPDC006984]|uniref:hypothetical protein n=1 Tax=Streptomyces sp. NPDC006984 TaxID=3155463 RepID=UPI0033C5879D